MIEHCRLRGSRRARIVMTSDRVQQLGRRALGLQHPQPQVHVAEERSLFRRAEDGRRPELARASHVVNERGCEQQIGAQSRMQLRQLAADRRHADGVLEQSAGVRVVTVRCRRIRSQRCVGERSLHRRAERVVVDLADEELQKALELVGVPAQGRSQRRRVDVRGLEGAHLELQPVAELLHPPENAHRVALGEARIEQLDVVPDPRGDPPARIDELERQVGRAVARAQPLLPGHRVDAVHRSVLLELCDRRHASSLKPDDAADPVLLLHQLEAAIHVVERDAV